ncbi:dehydrogenase/reductase SDR family member 13 [Sodiomyces alkalinus F11]|uniref:Dehydrogenase/reductase SDR family member 13 n=1 Tax=Sodiomyces alkalinus (strain CBS 110278 / VKM F-3762 / F11) TaxID=1314773 RepID=A0A3N2QAF8_SODAK|nr:dehydrogenase/reductase SDR family member 13 [Sodiomyces alkalinus F11]ROT43707.1 dehydrogenase/reductase SDR family member 13 [Sodiomyces alkalinus F11]
MFSQVSSQFKTIPAPAADLTGRTAIVTGSNVGLGLEASRYFAKLGCDRIVLACRDLKKAEAARKAILSSVSSSDSSSTSAIQPAPEVLVWHLDLADFDNVKAFAARAAKELDRVDFFMANASVASAKRQYAEAAGGWEMQLAVNVISTFLLNILMLPVLRETGRKFAVTPRLVVTASFGAFLSFFTERTAPNIFQALNENGSIVDRYNTTKLLQVIATKHLAVASRASGRGDVVINCLHPGVCRTELFRFVPFPLSIPFNAAMLLFGRSADMGARTLMAAALSDESDEANATHGRFMSDGLVAEFPPIMAGDEGEQMQVRVWEELLEILDGIVPGISRTI